MPKTAYEVAYIRALLEEASEELKVSGSDQLPCGISNESYDPRAAAERGIVKELKMPLCEKIQRGR